MTMMVQKVVLCISVVAILIFLFLNNYLPYVHEYVDMIFTFDAKDADEEKDDGMNMCTYYSYVIIGLEYIIFINYYV